MSAKRIFVHPDDVNLADVKAMAAELGCSADPNAYIPRGQMVVFDPDAINAAFRRATSQIRFGEVS